ncbi:SMI1/KNR4 family protein [Polymorphospora sp. NPDC051019]|uniref:SMI1/KNR4 family protein n=1 Tax=Polymorphospora sp. NPDC051019 TaxID=3155725 RepID=UPI003448A21B
MVIAGARHAFQVRRPGSSMLRVRYRAGVPVDPYGFPDWLPYARAVVRLPDVPDGVGLDEARVLGVLTANLVLAGTGDPLCPAGPTPDGPVATPAGWTWAFLARTRLVALVPVELHASFRHLGGISTLTAPRRGLGVPGTTGGPPRIGRSARLADDALAVVQERLGHPLPADYREFLAGTNGGWPVRPAVHPGFGFVVDQPMLGVARADWLHDLVYVNSLDAELLPGHLAIGYVQGGLITLRVADGSVWYLDDDDHRDTDGDPPARLLRRCADDFTTFWQALREPPATLTGRAESDIRAGAAAPHRLPGTGTALPPARRGPLTGGPAA